MRVKYNELCDIARITADFSTKFSESRSVQRNGLHKNKKTEEVTRKISINAKFDRPKEIICRENFIKIRVACKYN